MFFFNYYLILYCIVSNWYGFDRLPLQRCQAPPTPRGKTVTWIKKTRRIQVWCGGLEVKHQTPGGLEHFYFSIYIYIYIGNNHPNWLIFFRGVETTNQLRSARRNRTNTIGEDFSHQMPPTKTWGRLVSKNLAIMLLELTMSIASIYAKHDHQLCYTTSPIFCLFLLFLV